MFHAFFLSPRWRVIAWAGIVFILLATIYKVQLDVQINQWFGRFYNQLQDALSKPNQISFAEYLTTMLDFGWIVLIYVSLSVALEFAIRHYVFRWRHA